MSLADELLADFESDEFDGDDAEDPVDDKHNVKAHAENGVETGLNWDDMDGEGGFEAFGDMLEEGGNVKGEGGVVLGLDSPRKVARLLDSTKFKDIMREVREFMLKERGAVVGSVEMDPEYQLIVKANKMTVDIDGDIQVLHKYVRDIYSKRFPELEQLVHQPMEYMRTVQMIGNDLDIAKKDLASILPGPSVMIVTVSAANSHGSALGDADLANMNEACNMALELQAVYQEILEYVESRMVFIAPNLTAVCGSATAARLMGLAGGLKGLAQMPACNVEVLGASKKNLSGFSTAHMLPHTGFVYYCELVQAQAPEHRRKAARLVGGKASLAARIDQARQSSNGALGADMRADLVKKLEKMQEANPVKDVKALPKPDEYTSKKRAGKRVRKMKEKTAPTRMHKEQNRMKFGDVQDDMFQHAMGYDKGMIQSSGSGRVRGEAKIDDKTAKKISKRLQREVRRQNEISGTQTGIHTKTSQIGGAGTASSVAFTPVQGLEIINPNAAEKHIQEINSKYFANRAFKRVKQDADAKK